jgi:hypothetical protein
MIPILDTILGIGGKLIDKLIPDPQAKIEMKLKLVQLAQEGELKQMENETQLALAQIALNQEEAKSGSLFRGGWRPMIGWVCASGLSYQFLIQPLVAWWAGGHMMAVPPSLALGDLMTLLFGMLGLGAYRTYEKKEGVHND